MDPRLDTAPCGFLAFTDEGAIQSVNATLLGWLGHEPGSLVGQRVEALLPIASRIFYQTHFFPLLKMAGKVDEVYLTLRTASGEELPVLANAVRRDIDGIAVNDCVFLVVRQRSRYEDEILRARRTADEARLQLATTLRSIGDAVIATDAQGNVMLMNPVAEALTGWPQEEALGRPLDEIFVIINEVTREPVESPVSNVLREKRIVGLANHTLLVARDGLHCPIDDSGAPIRDSAGAILGVVLVFRDFTERRHTERALEARQTEIEALNQNLQRAMTETHHRVKNNLQVIAALVDLQIIAGAESVPVSSLQQVSQHIRGLAAIHDLLTHQTKQMGQGDRLSARATLHHLLPLLQGMTRGRQLHFVIADVTLPARQATALAVLANELVSNATKHGKGEIGIAFTVDTNRANFVVWDDGPGFPEGFSPQTSANTGIELVETISRFDLQGDVAYENRAEGGAQVGISFLIP